MAKRKMVDDADNAGEDSSLSDNEIVDAFNKCTSFEIIPPRVTVVSSSDRIAKATDIVASSSSFTNFSTTLLIMPRRDVDLDDDGCVTSPPLLQHEWSLPPFIPLLDEEVIVIQAVVSVSPVSPAVKSKTPTFLDSLDLDMSLRIAMQCDPATLARLASVSLSMRAVTLNIKAEQWVLARPADTLSILRHSMQPSVAITALASSLIEVFFSGSPADDEDTTIDVVIRAVAAATFIQTHQRTLPLVKGMITRTIATPSYLANAASDKIAHILSTPTPSCEELVGVRYLFDSLLTSYYPATLGERCQLLVRVVHHATIVTSSSNVAMTTVQILEIVREHVALSPSIQHIVHEIVDVVRAYIESDGTGQITKDDKYTIISALVVANGLGHLTLDAILAIFPLIGCRIDLIQSCIDAPIDTIETRGFCDLIRPMWRFMTTQDDLFRNDASMMVNVGRMLAVNAMSFGSVDALLQIAACMNESGVVFNDFIQTVMLKLVRDADRVQLERVIHFMQVSGRQDDLQVVASWVSHALRGIDSPHSDMMTMVPTNLWRDGIETTVPMLLSCCQRHRSDPADDELFATHRSNILRQACQRHCVPMVVAMLDMFHYPLELEDHAPFTLALDSLYDYEFEHLRRNEDKDTSTLIQLQTLIVQRGAMKDDGVWSVGGLAHIARTQRFGSVVQRMRRLKKLSRADRELLAEMLLMVPHKCICEEFSRMMATMSDDEPLPPDALLVPFIRKLDATLMVEMVREVTRMRPRQHVLAMLDTRKMASDDIDDVIVAAIFMVDVMLVGTSPAHGWLLDRYEALSVPMRKLDHVELLRTCTLQTVCMIRDRMMTLAHDTATDPSERQRLSCVLTAIQLGLDDDQYGATYDDELDDASDVAGDDN